MDLILAFSIFILALAISIINHIPIVVPVAIGLLCFILLALYRGFSVQAIGKMMKIELRRSFLVLQIFFFIGCLTAFWRASGTIPFLIYYGIHLIEPELFLLCAFLLSAFVSLLIGSSFGTAGTVGLALIILAKSGNVSVAMTAGAIFSGSFFGERIAFTSSAANLIAAVTDTDINVNIRHMLPSTIIPLILTFSAYAYLSLTYPLTVTDSAVIDAISQCFQLSWPVLLPVFTVLILQLFHCTASQTILYSTIVAAVVAVVVQQMTIGQLLYSAVFGFHLDGWPSLASILNGGGIISMVQVSILILLSSSYAGIIESIGAIDQIVAFLLRLYQKISLFSTLLVTSLIMNMIACNQTLAIMLTVPLVKPLYAQCEYSNEELALDLSNTALLLAPLIPWNLCCAVILAMLDVSVTALPYSFYLYLVPLCTLAYKLSKKKVCN